MVLIAQNLSAERGGRRLFAGVDLTLGEGEAIHLRGGNGSGKTTFLRALAGFEPLQSGRVLLEGRPVSSWPLWKREQIAPFVDQAPSLELGVRTIDNLIDSMLLPKVWDWWTTSKAQARRTAQLDTYRLLSEFGVLQDASFQASNLSLGQRRLLTIIRALRPRRDGGLRILLFDEPFAGVATCYCQKMVAEINMRLKAGWSLVIAEHLPIVEKLEISGVIDFNHSQF